MDGIKLNQWVELNQELLTLPKEVNFINCDTRDFHVICSEECPEGITYQESNEDKRLKLWELFAVLVILKKKTGGDGEWRHLELVNGEWLKYIHFVRSKEDPDTFRVYNNKGKSLDPDTLIEKINWSNPYVMTE